VFWGRIDPDTLDTIVQANAINSAGTFILNAHPACDPHTGQCYVEHGDFTHDLPVSDKVGVSLLATSELDITAHLLSENTIPTTVTLQHSHSPCVTPHFVVAKIDSFERRPALPKANYTRQGTLKSLRQREAG